MKVHFLKEDAMIALKSNSEANLLRYREDTNGWIYDQFQGSNPFVEFKTEVEDFQLTFDADNIGRSEVDNAKIIYKAMINLTDTQATDERLWAGMCHYDFWDYCRVRWQLDKGKTKFNSTDVASRYFLLQNKRRAVLTNTIAKLWWMGRFLYMPDRKDPYELFNYFYTDTSTKALVIFSNNFTGNAGVCRGLITALMELEKMNYKLPGLPRNVYYEAYKYLNVYGGTHILDYYTEQEIKERVMRHMLNLSDAQYD